MKPDFKWSFDNSFEYLKLPKVEAWEEDINRIFDKDHDLSATRDTPSAIPKMQDYRTDSHQIDDPTTNYLEYSNITSDLRNLSSHQRLDLTLDKFIPMNELLEPHTPINQSPTNKKSKPMFNRTWKSPKNKKTLSTARSRVTRLNVREIKKDKQLEDTICMERPSITNQDLEGLINLDDLKEQLGERLFNEEIASLADPDNNAKIGLGEGGRELIKIAIAVVAQKCMTKGASVRGLINEALKNGLHGLVHRISIERKHSIPCAIHLKFITYMSEKKTLERVAYKRKAQMERPCKSPEELWDYWLRNRALPQTVKLSDTGRNEARRLLRETRAKNVNEFEVVLKENMLDFQRMRFWTNATLMLCIVLFDILKPFSIAWYIKLNKSKLIELNENFEDDNYVPKFILQSDGQLEIFSDVEEGWELENEKNENQNSSINDLTHQMSTDAAFSNSLFVI